MIYARNSRLRVDIERILNHALFAREERLSLGSHIQASPQKNEHIQSLYETGDPIHSIIWSRGDTPLVSSLPSPAKKGHYKIEIPEIYQNHIQFSQIVHQYTQLFQNQGVFDAQWSSYQDKNAHTVCKPGTITLQGICKQQGGKIHLFLCYGGNSLLLPRDWIEDRGIHDIWHVLSSILQS